MFSICYVHLFLCIHIVLRSPLCIQDPDNPNMIYGTAVGVDFTTFQYVDQNAGIWSINTDDWTVTRLYDGSNTIIGDGYVYHPNGCIINDGVIYLVEVRIDGTGAFGMYDIDTGVFMYDNTVLNKMGDGIVYSEPYFFMTAFLAQELLAMNAEETNSTFEVVLSGLGSIFGVDGPADLCLGPNNVLAIPNQAEANIYFAQFEIDDGDATTTTAIPFVNVSTTSFDDESNANKLRIITVISTMVIISMYTL